MVEEIINGIDPQVAMLKIGLGGKISCFHGDCEVWRINIQDHLDIKINDQDSPQVNLKILSSLKAISWFTGKFQSSMKFGKVETKLSSSKKKIPNRR
jgi:hypothetical protein